MITILLALTALITFAFLYVLVFAFEKNRAIDSFLVAEAVVVPIIAAFLPAVAVGLLGYMMLAGWLWTLILLGATYFTVWRLLEMPAFRAAGYAAAVAAFSFGVQLGLLSLR
jgi:hypothetical protein